MGLVVLCLILLIDYSLIRNPPKLGDPKNLEVKMGPQTTKMWVFFNFALFCIDAPIHTMNSTISFCFNRDGGQVNISVYIYSSLFIGLFLVGPLHNCYADAVQLFHCCDTHTQRERLNITWEGILIHSCLACSNDLLLTHSQDTPYSSIFRTWK